MKNSHRLFCILPILLTLASCNVGKNKKIDPIPQTDSSQLVAPGIVQKININTETYIDTGIVVTVRGTQFDKTFKNDYFLFIHHDGNKFPLGSTQFSNSYSGNIKKIDSNLVSINDSTIVFDLPPHILSISRIDSAILYFCTLDRTQSRYNPSADQTQLSWKIMFRKSFGTIPTFNFIKDTLYLTNNLLLKNKEVYASGLRSGAVDIYINGIEYPHGDNFLWDNQDYEAPHHRWVTTSMIATKYDFVMPDGWYPIEIYENSGLKRKFVEETGKSKIYVKNEK